MYQWTFSWYTLIYLKWYLKWSQQPSSVTVFRHMEKEELFRIHHWWITKVTIIHFECLWFYWNGGNKKLSVFYYNNLEITQYQCSTLSHWGRVTHICVSKLSIIGSDNGLSPDRRQAIIWTNAGILLIGPLGTNFSETVIESHISSFKKTHLKMSSAKWFPFCLGHNMLSLCLLEYFYTWAFSDHRLSNTFAGIYW